MRPSLSQVPVLIGVCLSVLVLILAGLRNLWLRGRHVLVRRLSAGLLAGWLICVLILTLSGIDRQAGPPVFNLIPFRGGDRTITEMLGNVLMFVPGGAVIAVGWNKRTSWRFVLAVGFVLSLGIEIVQGLSRMGRAADVTDVILNSAGMVAGYLTCVTWTKMWIARGMPRPQLLGVP